MWLLGCELSHDLILLTALLLGMLLGRFTGAGFRRRQYEKAVEHALFDARCAAAEQPTARSDAGERSSQSERG
jgi:hypothetical protein